MANFENFTGGSNTDKSSDGRVDMPLNKMDELMAKETGRPVAEITQEREERVEAKLNPKHGHEAFTDGSNLNDDPNSRVDLPLEEARAAFEKATGETMEEAKQKRVDSETVEEPKKKTFWESLKLWKK